MLFIILRTSSKQDIFNQYHKLGFLLKNCSARFFFIGYKVSVPVINYNRIKLLRAEVSFMRYVSIVCGL